MTSKIISHRDRALQSEPTSDDVCCIIVGVQPVHGVSGCGS